MVILVQREKRGKTITMHMQLVQTTGRDVNHHPKIDVVLNGYIHDQSSEINQSDGSAKRKESYVRGATVLGDR